MCQSFSDSKNGWAYYNGELRHGSNHEGPKYGETSGKGDVVAVILDTVQVSYAHFTVKSFNDLKRLKKVFKN